MREFSTRTMKDHYTIIFETDERKAYEQVQTLCRILVDGKDSEAIPIEWLRMWFTKKASLIGITLVSEIESDWEKENG